MAVSPNGYTDDFGPNVSNILAGGTRVIRGRVPLQVRKELRAAVKAGVLCHMPKEGLKPEIFFHPGRRVSANDIREREALYAVQCISGVIASPAHVLEGIERNGGDPLDYALAERRSRLTPPTHEPEIDMTASKNASRDKISRAFRQDFPEFVERAELLGIRISLSPGKRGNLPRAFWLDGYRQLTGYTTRSDGGPFTHEDAVRNIDKALAEIEDDRRSIAAMSIEERFSRVMDEFQKMEPQYRMIGEVRLPSGDGGHCFFMAEYDGEVRLHDVGTVARAKAEWRKGETSKEQMSRFCDLLQQNFIATA